MKKKIIVFLIGILITSVFTIPVSANEWEQNYDEAIISPMYVYISTATARLNVNSSGEATVETYLTGTREVTSTKATINLQQYKNGRWTTIKTWNESSSTRILNFSSTYNVSEGYSYRVRSTVTAYSGQKSESTTVTSSSQSY